MEGDTPSVQPTAPTATSTGAGLFLRYNSSDSESSQDSPARKRSKHKHKPKHKHKHKHKHKKEKKSKKKSKKKKKTHKSEHPHAQEDRVRETDAARHRAGLSWMTETPDIFKPPQHPHPQPQPQPKEVEEETPFVRPYGLFDPKKHKQTSQSPPNDEEEVDEFGRSRPRRVKRERGVEEAERRRDEVKESIGVGVVVDVDVDAGVARHAAQEVTKEALNKLVAQALKAQLKGDTAKYAELTERVKDMKLLLQSQEEDHEAPLRTVDERGRRMLPVHKEDVPLAKEDLRNKSKRGMRFHQNLVHRDGGLNAHFVSEMEESKQSVQDLLRAEKASSRDALSDNYLRNMAKKGAKFRDPMLERRGVESEEVDVSLFESKTGKMTAKRLAEHQEKQARAANRKLAEAEQSSPFSFSNPRFNKALVMSTGSSTYLMLAFHPLAEGHCRIVPITPVASLNDASDEVFEEISKYKRSLEAMAMQNGQSLVYMETVMNAKQPGWHTCLDCIPVDEEVAENIPMYFKRAIMESDEEWSTHKKAMDTSEKSIRNVVPVGFPYFHVEWGGGGYKGGGYAHVIEDPTKFPSSFGSDVLRGAMGVAPLKFNRTSLGLAEDKKRITSFQEAWKKHDWVSASS